MTSKLGYIPEDRKDVANGLQVAANPNVIYASPAGFHLTSSIPAAATVTYTARQMLGGVIVQTTSANTAATTATAADLVAGFNNPTVNSSIMLWIIQSGANVITLTGGTGVTVTGTNTIGNNLTGVYLLTFTNVTPGSEAVTMRTLINNGAH